MWALSGKSLIWGHPEQDSGIYVALSTAPLDAWSPSYSEPWPSPPVQPLTCSFSKTFFFGLSSSSGSPPS